MFKIGRVVSGAAGLHLNILNVLVRAKDSKDKTFNLTQACTRKLAEAIHLTAAVYIQSEHYMDNTVCHFECESFRIRI